MKTIYFIRHGSTEGTEKNLYQHPDIALSDEGKRQVEVVARRLSSLKPDLIISSDMNRAAMTADEINKSINAPRITESLFREIMRPTVVRGRPQDNPEVEEIMNLIKKNYDDPHWHYSDEENFYDLKKRAEAALSFLDSRPESLIFVVTHGHFLRMMLAFMSGGEKTTSTDYKNTLRTFYVSPTGISIAKTYKDKLSLHTWNDYSHLESHL